MNFMESNQGVLRFTLEQTPRNFRFPLIPSNKFVRPESVEIYDFAILSSYPGSSAAHTEQVALDPGFRRGERWIW